MKKYTITARWVGVTLHGSATVRDIIEINDTTYMLVKQEQSTEEAENILNASPERTEKLILTKDALRKVNDPYGALFIISRRPPDWKKKQIIRCECGADKCALPIHSSWCPKHRPRA